MIQGALAAAGAAGARALPAIMTSARALASRVFGTSAATVTAAATRTGVVGGAQKLLGAMSNNKFMTALVLLELGTEGAELLNEMAAQDREVAELVARYGLQVDDVSSGIMSNLAQQREELSLISDAAFAVGGLSNLHKIRAALKLSEDHYKLYDTVRLMSRGLAR